MVGPAGSVTACGAKARTVEFSAAPPATTSTVVHSDGRPPLVGALTVNAHSPSPSYSVASPRLSNTPPGVAYSEPVVTTSRRSATQTRESGPANPRPENIRPRPLRRRP